MISSFVHSFVTLFATANPLSFLPIYLVLVANLTPPQQRRVATLAVIIAGTLLIVFSLVGHAILSFLGITIGAFQVAGGILLFVIGFRMVFATETPHTATASSGGANVAQMAAFPLAIPLMAGPGAISATIIIATDGSGGLVDLLTLIAAIVALMILTVIVLLLAERFDRIIGRIGQIVMGRLFGTILAALAAQFIADGTIRLVHYGVDRFDSAGPAHTTTAATLQASQ